MADILVWPHDLLTPLACYPNIVPFSRSGGRTLGGIETATRTDLGFWSIELADVPVHSPAQRRTWLAIRRDLGGRPGLVAVPAWSHDVAPFASGEFEPEILTTHADETAFSDGSKYLQGAISIRSVGVTGIGQTVIRLRVVHGSLDLSGVRFSYGHALYETGRLMDLDGNIATVSIWPTVRATIPADAELEFDRPTCLCHLASDDQLAAGVDALQFERRSVQFVEATDYWYRLAKGLI